MGVFEGLICLDLSANLWDRRYSVASDRPTGSYFKALLCIKDEKSNTHVCVHSYLGWVGTLTYELIARRSNTLTIFTDTEVNPYEGVII